MVTLADAAPSDTGWGTIQLLITVVFVAFVFWLLYRK